MSRIYFGLAGLNALYLGTGYALLYAIGLVRLRARDVRFVGLAYLAGWALLGTLLSLVVMAGIGLRPLTTAVVALIAAAVCVVAARWRPDELPAATVRTWSLPAAAATAVGGALIAIAAASALVTSFTSVWVPELDLLSAWLPRAEIVLYLHRLDPSQWASFIDPWYPPLVPVQYGTAFQFIGGFHPSLLSFQQTLLGTSFVLAVLVLLDRHVPRWISFPSLALLMTTPWFWWRLRSLMPDPTLSYLIGAALVVIVMWLYEPRGAWLVLGTVFLAAAALSKLEGYVFGALIVATMLVAGLVRHRRRALPGLVLFLGPAAIVPWRAWLDTHQVANTNPDFNTPQLSSPSFLVDRAGALAHSLRLLLLRPWGPFDPTEVLLVAGFVVIVCVARRIPLIAAATLVSLGLMIVALATTYAVSRMNLDAYFNYSANRVGGTFVVAFGILAPLLLGLALRETPRSRGAPAWDAEPEPAVAAPPAESEPAASTQGV